MSRTYLSGSSVHYGIGCIFFFKQKTAYDMRISDWSSDVCSSDLDAADHETVGVGIVEDAFAFAEQILDQVAVAQFGVRHLFHHHGMGGVIGLGKHGIASSLEIIWLAALLVLMVTGVKGDRKSTRLNSSH